MPAANEAVPPAISVEVASASAPGRGQHAAGAAGSRPFRAWGRATRRGVAAFCRTTSQRQCGGRRSPGGRQEFPARAARGSGTRPKQAGTRTPLRPCGQGARPPSGSPAAAHPIFGRRETIPDGVPRRRQATAPGARRARLSSGQPLLAALPDYGEAGAGRWLRPGASFARSRPRAIPCEALPTQAPSDPRPCECIVALVSCRCCRRLMCAL